MLGTAYSDLTSRHGLSLCGCALLATPLKPIFFSDPDLAQQAEHRQLRWVHL